MAEVVARRRRFVLFSLIVLVVAAPLVFGAPPVIQAGNTLTTWTVVVPERASFPVGKNNSFHVHVFNASGYQVARGSARCFFHLYDENNRHVISKQMYNDSSGIDYSVKLDYKVNDTGEWGYIVWCNGTRGAGFVAASFMAMPDGRNPTREGGLFGVIVGLVALLGVMLLLSSYALGDDHVVLKWGLWLLSFFPVVYAVRLGMDAAYRFYGVTVFGDALSDGLTWAAWVFGVILFYLVVYLLVLVFRGMAKRRAERLEY